MIPSARRDPAGAAVHFLSDYGLVDEFVGVVHAVVIRIAPVVAVVDITHGIPPFDVRAGAACLLRAVPHLGPGAVLGVVDPGVGTTRRGVVLEAADVRGPRWFVGPDNGLLPAAAERAGGIVGAWALRRPPDAPATFDGRDVFAPAAALLAAGADATGLGDRIAVTSIERLAPPRVEHAAPGDAARWLRAEVTWVDRFGNVQLGAPGAVVDAVGPPGTVVRVSLAAPSSGRPPLEARSARAFGDLAPGTLGVLSDANGQAAVVAREASAALLLGAGPGDVVELAW